MVLYTKGVLWEQNFQTESQTESLQVTTLKTLLTFVVNWEEFVFEVAEWGVDHIAQVDFDDLDTDDVKALDEFIASFGCSPEQPHPCSKYADPIFA